MESRIHGTDSPVRSLGENETDDPNRRKRLMKYKKTNITQMLDPETMSPSRGARKQLSSIRLGDSPTPSSVFPELKISRFNATHRPDDSPQKYTSILEGQMIEASSLSPKPVRKQSESFLNEDLYPAFKAKFKELSIADQANVLRILKGIMMDSPTHRVLEHGTNFQSYLK